MQALEVPVLKSVVVAALAAGALALAPHHSHKHRLILHAPVAANSLYLSAWMDGPVELELDPANLQPLRFDMRAHVTDGCRWHGWEILTPEGDHYRYTYDDAKLSCVPNPPIETVPSHRVGWVEVR